MLTLSAWMMAQQRDRYAREAMYWSDVLDSFSTRGAGAEAGPSRLGEWIRSLRHLVRSSADPATACCAA